MTSNSWIERERASWLQSRHAFSQVLDRGAAPAFTETDANAYLVFVSSQVVAYDDCFQSGTQAANTRHRAHCGQLTASAR